MRDMERAQFTTFVLGHLKSREFRSQLRVATEDGATPLVIALPTDPMRDVLAAVEGHGGAANVAMEFLNGVVVFGVTGGSGVEGDSPAAASAPHPIDVECTVGVFFARLYEDGQTGEYRFVMARDGEGASEQRAELTGVAS